MFVLVKDNNGLHLGIRQIDYEPEKVLAARNIYTGKLVSLKSVHTVEPGEKAYDFRGDNCSVTAIESKHCPLAESLAMMSFELLEEVQSC